MENSLLYNRVAALPEEFGTLEEIKRYLSCKRDCEKRTRLHEDSPRRTATLKQLTAKISALQALVEYMDANGAPYVRVAISGRMQEICCPSEEIEQYLVAIENLPKFLASERKPAVSLPERLMAIIAWRPRFSSIPGLSRTSA